MCFFICFLKIFTHFAVNDPLNCNARTRTNHKILKMTISCLLFSLFLSSSKTLILVVFLDSSSNLSLLQLCRKLGVRKTHEGCMLISTTNSCCLQPQLGTSCMYISLSFFFSVHLFPSGSLLSFTAGCV